MANRHLSRSIVLQSLFEWDFSGKTEDVDFLKAIVDRDVAEFAPDHTDTPFIYTLVETVQRKQAIIDDIIVKAAPEWPLEKISNVDRNVLRMGLAELLFGDREQVPPKVAINEAIELAKAFGGENSSRFVNGVLGSVYKEIGEPGKEQASKSRNKNEEEVIDLANIAVEAKAGAIIYAIKDGVPYVALVHDVFGYWTVLKGGMEEGETNEQTAIREIKEKVGLDITIVQPLGAIEYIASHPEKKKVRKVATYFLAHSEYAEMDLHSSGGLDKVQWFQLSELPDLIIYDDTVPLLAKAVEYITGLN